MIALALLLAGSVLFVAALNLLLREDPRVAILEQRVQLQRDARTNAELRVRQLLVENSTAEQRLRDAEARVETIEQLAERVKTLFMRGQNAKDAAR